MMMMTTMKKIPEILIGSEIKVKKKGHSKIKCLMNTFMSGRSNQKSMNTLVIHFIFIVPYLVGITVLSVEGNGQPVVVNILKNVFASVNVLKV